MNSDDKSSYAIGILLDEEEIFVSVKIKNRNSSALDKPMKILAEVSAINNDNQTVNKEILLSPAGRILFVQPA